MKAACLLLLSSPGPTELQTQVPQSHRHQEHGCSPAHSPPSVCPQEVWASGAQIFMATPGAVLGSFPTPPSIRFCTQLLLMTMANSHSTALPSIIPKTSLELDSFPLAFLFATWICSNNTFGLHGCNATFIRST